MTPWLPPSPLPRAFMALGLVLFFVVLMRIGAPVVVPVVEAVLVCFLLNAAAAALRRIPGIGPRLPRSLALLAAAVIALIASLWVVETSVRTVATMGPQLAGYETALAPLLDRAGAVAGLSGPELSERLIGAFGFDAVVRQVVGATASTINHFGIVAIYAVFLLVDQQFFGRKLRALQPDPVRREETRRLIDQVTEGVETYLLIMTFVSALTSLLSYAVMRLMGVDHAVFWATMIFFLNFIPTIGSILGTVIPAGFALLQFQALLPALLVLAGVGIVQFAMGNILLPRMFGTRLNISLGVTIFALFFWGALWGVTGMFVALPLTAILVIGFSHFEATRPLAILLSRTGEIESPRAAARPG